MADILIEGIRLPDHGKIMVELQAGGSARYIDSYGVLKTVKATTISDHGRMIEAEPIMKFITDGLNSGEFGYDQIKVLTEIQYAPTIIPASKEE